MFIQVLNNFWTKFKDTDHSINDKKWFLSVKKLSPLFLFEVWEIVRGSQYFPELNNGKIVFVLIHLSKNFLVVLNSLEKENVKLIFYRRSKRKKICFIDKTELENNLEKKPVSSEKEI